MRAARIGKNTDQGFVKNASISASELNGQCARVVAKIRSIFARGSVENASFSASERKGRNVSVRAAHNEKNTSLGFVKNASISASERKGRSVSVRAAYNEKLTSLVFVQNANENELAKTTGRGVPVASTP